MNVLYFMKRAGLIFFSALLLCSLQELNAQGTSSELTGIVTDGLGDPLAGVTITTDGQGRGAITGSGGVFTISVNRGDVLTFSYLGYESARITYTGQNNLMVSLNPATQSIDEIVVVGYGVQRKRDVTGSIASVKSEDLATTVAAANPMQALQGKVAGVEVVQNSAPGGAPTVRVRGVSSFRNTDPVYVVDGLILDNIAFLNPNDIQSMEILKDASSTAIYGSRGANGVIIITTKQGRKNQKAMVDFDANFSYAQMEKYLPYATASQFLTLKNRNQMALNAAGTVVAPLPYTDEEIAAAGKGTDWQKEITQLAFTQNYNINVTGGGEKSTYGFNAGFFDQEGVMKKSDYQRTNVRISNTYDLTKWATIGSSVSFIYEQRHSQGSSLSSALRALPTAPVRDPNNPDQFFGPVDEIGKSGNPVASLYYNSDNYANYYKTLANIYMNLEVAKNLFIRSTFTLDNSNSENKAFYPSFFVNVDQKRTDNQLSIGQSRTFRWLNENTISYLLEKGKHRMDAVAGITLQENKSQSMSSSILQLPDSAWKNRNLWYLGQGKASTLTGSSSGTNYAYISYLARVNYSFADKYMFTGTVRVDGSSRFPADGRYGTFPAFGAGWAIKEEGFLKDVNWLSQLKLRTSWGIVGSDAGIPNNVQTVYTNKVTGVFGKNPDSATTSEVIDAIIDYNLSWEEARQFNIGLDFGAFGSRLTLEMDYYRKTTKDIITAAPYPGVSGTSYSPLSNIATARNTGVEFNLGWRDTKGDFSYRMNLIGTTLKNKVTAVNRDLAPGEYGVSRVLVGYPIGGFWGYEVLGIYQDQTTIDQTAHISGAMPGDLWYKDQDGSGQPIDTNDRIYMGSYLPKVTLGYNFGMSWKGLEFNIDLYASLGGKIYSERRQTLGTPNYNVSWDDFKDSWIGPGSTNKYTRVLTDGTGTNNNNSQYFLENGSYFRIRNVVLGYSLPQKWVSKLYMRDLQIYAAVNNLLTVSNVTGYSPECGGGPTGAGRDNYDNYPASRTFSFGIKIGF